MYVVYHGVSVCMCMREFLASSCGFMPRSPSRCLACLLVSAVLENGTLRMSLETAKLFREHSNRGWSPAVAMKIYLHATTCTVLV